MTRNITEPHPGARRSLSTRRSFIAATSFGAVSLYGVWAGLGAAPLRFWPAEQPDAAAMGGGHEGHGAAASGPSAEEFRRAAEAFNASHSRDDGSVAVDGPPAMDPAMPDMNMDMGLAASGESGHAGHAMPGMTMETAAQDAMPQIPDVYLLARQWSFEPAVLRLKADQPYRFRMMAVDAAHGASIQLGSASHVIRLPKGVAVNRQLSFTRPGSYLLYCTMYCGEGHQYMSGKILVA